jgi:hypothetical protein
MAEHPHLRVFRHTITMRLAFVRWNSSNEIDFAGCAREPMREPAIMVVAIWPVGARYTALGAALPPGLGECLPVPFRPTTAGLSQRRRAVPAAIPAVPCRRSSSLRPPQPRTAHYYPGCSPPSSHSGAGTAPGPHCIPERRSWNERSFRSVGALHKRRERISRCPNATIGIVGSGNSLQSLSGFPW